MVLWWEKCCRSAIIVFTVETLVCVAPAVQPSRASKKEWSVLAKFELHVLKRERLALRSSYLYQGKRWEMKWKKFHNIYKALVVAENEIYLRQRMLVAIRTPEKYLENSTEWLKTYREYKRTRTNLLVRRRAFYEEVTRPMRWLSTLCDIDAKIRHHERLLDELDVKRCSIEANITELMRDDEDDVLMYDKNNDTEEG